MCPVPDHGDWKYPPSRGQVTVLFPQLAIDLVNAGTLIPLGIVAGLAGAALGYIAAITGRKGRAAAADRAGEVAR